MTSDTSGHTTPLARLSYNDFEIAIKAFLRQTRHHSPWSYVEYSPRRETTSTAIDPADLLLLDELTEQLDDIPDYEGEEDESSLDPVIETADTTTLDFLSVNYHIVFSPSYQVPVLYFNAYRPDGAAISLEEIYESLVPEEWRGAIRNAGLNGGISQQDHPVLNTPYFYMHPCETVALMETVLQNSSSSLMNADTADESQTSYLETYIVTWLSFTGQAIGVSVPTDVVAFNTQ
ncbi:hypothetical protein BGX23_007092 [Mortierella sp. AD031]|nr:hypothetical protein BGX23_007092 [Mortierella sp. AD031]KAG0211756.1 hypothetical protein BGX33_004098 [Mortierella sp. NVP41]